MANQISGKQLRDATITEAKLDSTYAAALLKRDGSVALTGNLDAGSQRIVNLAAPTNPTDAVRLQDLHNRAQKEVVAAATTANITLSGAQSIDGVAITTQRVLVKDQTIPSENGIYQAAAGAWSRTADADSSAELDSALVVVAAGTANADRLYLQTSDNPTVGTSPIAWIQVGSQSVGSVPTAANKSMAASATSAAFDLACATPVASTPVSDGYVACSVNGVFYEVGNGVRNSDFYFSSDSGATAKSIVNIASGDLLYVGSGLSFQLETTDRISFYFE
ncbi:MAG: hypothetical protein ACOYBP_08990 [Microbacteriaceae bacterium]